MNTKSPVHLLLRFSDSLLKDGDTIEEHNQVVNRDGAVWFGKMGSTVSQNQIDIFTGQVQDNIPTYVYLVKGNRRKSTAFRGELVLASKFLPKGEEHLVPSYYADLNKMQVASSYSHIGESLVRSSSGHFIIREDKMLY